MLDCSQAPRLIEGLTVYPDHEDPTRFFVLPEPPHLATGADGQPRLGLWLFRASPDQPGGGLLQMEVELTLAPERSQAIVAALAAGGATPTLVEPPWLSGSAMLIGWLGGDTGASEDAMVLQRFAEGEPSLGPDGRVVFAARLDEPGAELLHSAITAGGVPAGVAYQLETLGLAGPLGIEVDVNLHGTRDYFAVKGGVTGRFVKAQVTKAMEDLVTARLVTVRVVDQSGNTDGARAEALRRAGEQMVETLFQPAMSPVAFKEQAPGQLAQLGISLRMESDSIAESATWSYRERSAVRMLHTPQVSLGVIAGGLDAKQTCAPSTAPTRSSPRPRSRCR
jgi:hypothetical protein